MSICFHLGLKEFSTLIYTDINLFKIIIECSVSLLLSSLLMILLLLFAIIKEKILINVLYYALVFLWDRFTEVDYKVRD